MPRKKQVKMDPHPTPLDDLAAKHGIAPTRPEPDGTEVPITQDTKRKILAALNVFVEGEDLPHGPVCFLPQLLSQERVWGLSLQLYELRSARNWGIGDFRDLADLCALAGEWGADFIGLNPLHAPFLADPARCSPYEPSNRCWLNPLYIAVDRLPSFAADEEQMNRIRQLRESALVDYPSLAAEKLAALKTLWGSWQAGKMTSTGFQPAAFEAFRQEGGEALRLHALFETISMEMVAQGNSAGWHAWPQELQDPQAPAVQEFAQSRLDDIDFHIWLQWLAHVQLTQAADAAKRVGLRIGLYLDLAVGEALDGSATWGEREFYVSAASIGGPPDPWAISGQDWRLAAFLPDRIAEGDPSPYRRMLDSAMRYAGAIRIDHAAALSRLFLVPSDGTPAEGAYVDYPKEALLKVLEEASHHHKSLVIGEDLGNLPGGLKEDLAAARILSYRIFSYERDERGFIPAEDYPALALACVSTHDHQTLGGWWTGADVQARIDHKLVPKRLAEQDMAARSVERADLVRILEAEALAAPDAERLELDDEALDRLIISLHRFLARSPSMLMAVRLADLTKESQPTNIPGTSESHPNWQTRLSATLEELAELPLLREVVHVLNDERGRGRQS